MASSRIDSQAIRFQQNTLRLCSVSTETQNMTDCPSCYAYEQKIARLEAQLKHREMVVVPSTPITPMTTVLGL